MHVIPHGVLHPGEGPPGGAARGEDGDEASLPAELRGVERPVVLFFGLLRPYKGIDVLLDAWRQRDLGGSGGAELWIVGMPRMDIGSLRCRRAGRRAVRSAVRLRAGDPRRDAPREPRRAALPRDRPVRCRLHRARPGGSAAPLSDVGGFPEIAATGAAHTVPAGDPAALGEALEQLLGDPGELAAMASRARAAAAGEYAWADIARRTLELYARLLDG